MYILFAALFVLLLYMAQFELYKRTWANKLKVSARFNIFEVYEGEDASLEETIENAKLLPLPMVTMKLQLSRKLLFHEKENTSVSDFYNRTDIYAIKSSERVIRTLKFTCSKRGYYDFNGVDVIGTDLFLSNEFVKKINTSSFLYVFPKICDSHLIDPILNKINGEMRTKRNLVEDPFELRGIREYQTYDSMKNVNWKASAKTDDLMVNMHDYTTRSSLRIFLHLEDSSYRREDELKELCISMAMAVIEEFSMKSVPVCFYTSTMDCITNEYIHLDEGCGEGFTYASKKALARIDLSKGSYSLEDSILNYLYDAQKDSYTVIVSSYLKPEFQDAIHKLTDKDCDFSWICPHYMDSSLKVYDSLKSNTHEIDAKEALLIYEKSYS